MSVEVKPPGAVARRQSVYVESFTHSNPIPAACRIDNIVYSSIIHGVDRDDPDAASSLEAQAERMFKRLALIVEASGAALADVAKVTMFMRDRSARESINRFWCELFPDADSRPARQTVNAQLDGTTLIQCDFVAVINPQGEQRS